MVEHVDVHDPTTQVVRLYVLNCRIVLPSEIAGGFDPPVMFSLIHLAATFMDRRYQPCPGTLLQKRPRQ